MNAFSLHLSSFTWPWTSGVSPAPATTPPLVEISLQSAMNLTTGASISSSQSLTLTPFSSFFNSFPQQKKVNCILKHFHKVQLPKSNL